MADVLRFVDSVASSPTTRLDLNDDTAVLHVRDVQWNPPRLRRSVSQNMLRDGGYVGPSSYDLRTLVLTFDVVASDVDTLATHLQNLARELDRETNWLKYQPTGATHPVFFKTYRSDITGFADIPAAVAFRQLTVELLTDPHAPGLQETFSGTVSQDGTSGSSFVATTPTIKGDVPAPFALDLDGTGIYSARPLHIAAIASTSSLSLTRLTANASFTLGTDASNVTGAGGAYWNGDYVNVSFGTTATDAARARFNSSLAAGRWRVLVQATYYNAVPTATNYATVEVRQVSSGGTTLQTATPTRMYENNFGPLLYSMGVFTVPYGGSSNPSSTSAYFDIRAARTSGTGALRIDGVVFVPVALSTVVAQSCALTSRVDGGATDGMVFDGMAEATYYGDYGAGLPFAPPALSGSLGLLAPGFTNTLVLASGTGTISYAAYYHPLYTTIRPVST